MFIKYKVTANDTINVETFFRIYAELSDSLEDAEQDAANSEYGKDFVCRYADS